MGNFEIKPKKRFAFMAMDKDHDKIFKGAVIGAFSALLLMLITAAIVFFMSIQPRDETIAPRVVGLNLAEAILLLQENDLVPRLTMRFTDLTEERGRIIEQSPRSGSYVKIGKQVDLVVSAGAAINKVENFAGKTIDQVRSRLVTAYSGMLSIKEPSIYVFNDNPPGTVISQDPPAGAEIAGPRQIALTVSRGEASASIPVGSYVGLSYMQAMALASEANLPFAFNFDSDKSESTPSVLTQMPMQGIVLGPRQAIKFTIAQPQAQTGEVYGLFSYAVPDSPEPLPVSFIIREDGQADKTLFVTHQAGVELTVPIIAPAAARLVVKINNMEVEEKPAVEIAKQH